MMSESTYFVLDSSVIVSIILQEPDAEDFKRYLAARDVAVGAPTLVETAIVLTSRLGSERAMRDLLSFLERTNCETIDFTGLHFMEAATAFEKYGKGRHPAGLNMGDCNSYATAKLARATLLYKGDDFALTDLPPLTLPA